MRALYTGVIGFGLVSIPIQVFKAMESERVTTHWIHETCRTRIQYQKYCPQCDRVVEKDEIATGAPLPDGRFVILPPEDGGPASDHTISILNFPELTDIDPVYWETAYWLKPAAGGHKAYALLTRTMRELGRVALAEMTLRTRPALAVVRPYNDHALMLHRMYYPESLRLDGAEFGVGAAQPTDEEMNMANVLVQHMAQAFEPSRYPNRYRQERLRQIEELAPATPPSPVAYEREVLDLMERLKASVRNRPSRDAGTVG